MAVQNYVYSQKKNLFHFLSHHIKIPLAAAMIMIQQLNVSINHWYVMQILLTIMVIQSYWAFLFSNMNLQPTCF